MSLKHTLSVLSTSLALTLSQPVFASPINLSIVSNSAWMSSNTFTPNWETVGFNDSGWSPARSPYPNANSPTDIIPGTTASFMWYDPTNASDGTNGSVEAYFRFTFNLDLQADSYPIIGLAFIQVDDDYDLFINGTLKKQNHDGGYANVVDFVNFTSLLQIGDNVIAIHAKDGGWGGAFDRIYEEVLFSGVVKTASIPEPSSLLLLMSGIGWLAWPRRRAI